MDKKTNKKNAEKEQKQKKDKKNAAKLVEQPVFIVCPRCELNYINKKEKYCKVCKASLGLIATKDLISDDEVGERLCPVCNSSYLSEDETVCFICIKKSKEEENADLYEPDIIPSSLSEGSEPPVIETEEIPVTIDADVAVEESTEEAEDYSELYKEPDDFDFEVNESDFETEYEGDDDDDDDL